MKSLPETPWNESGDDARYWLKGVRIEDTDGRGHDPIMLVAVDNKTGQEINLGILE